MRFEKYKVLTNCQSVSEDVVEPVAMVVSAAEDTGMSDKVAELVEVMY
ncbi:29801_t:CDS:2 [Gigaspora margarita]|uniref:29801_t:CDS:1 n=1 Tax=Gigaspora margarita TaxID=4874 RepID=A0ABN7UHL8_GIGMA|nr:29801_t:CDS:2 [Gigaspora margarita]